jgi:hypothetical protein
VVIVMSRRECRCGARRFLTTNNIVTGYSRLIMSGAKLMGCEMMFHGYLIISSHLSLFINLSMQ